MARLPIELPPGVFRNGTEYQSKGRYYDANLVRWYGVALGPVGGWQLRNPSASAMSGVPRGALSWKDNASNSWLGIGTASHLYISNIVGGVFDVTPTVAFTSGRDTATGAGGYGSGTYGSGTYGTPRPGLTQIMDATEWTMAPWGQNLLAVSPDDGKLRQWVPPTTTTVAATVTNSPACTAVCVTAERFVFALATTDPRTVSWCDQENNTVWTPSTTNQAGSFPLQTIGRLMCGVGVRGGTILFTDIDAWLAQYIGGTLIYSFDRIGDSCGIISRNAAASVNEQAVWMSPSLGFWQSIGSYVKPLDCDVLDYIREDINTLQISKVFAAVNSQNSEVEWRYCSGSSSEIDKCVVWNYKTGEWNIGRVARTAGVDRGAFQNPVLMSSTGYIYDHEVGWTYDGMVPYATGGPIELGNGDKIMHVLGMIPDDETVGDVSVSFMVRRDPDDPGVTKGPYSLSARTDLRFSGGLVEVTYTGVQLDNWRVGSPRLDVKQGEER